MAVIGAIGWNPSGSSPITYDEEVAADSPIFYFKLDDADDLVSAPLIDSSGNENDGQNINPAPGVSVSPLHVGSTAALYAVFDSSVELMESSLNVLPLSGSFSVEVWVNIQLLNDADVIMSRWGSVQNLFAITLNDVGGSDFRARLSILDSTSTPYSIDSSLSLSASTSYHIVVTYSSANDWNMYVNVVNVNSIAQNRRVVTDATLRLNTYGDASTTTMGNCEYDSWALYGTELSATRIAAHFAAGQ